MLTKLRLKGLLYVCMVSQWILDSAKNSLCGVFGSAEQAEIMLESIVLVCGGG